MWLKYSIFQHRCEPSGSSSHIYHFSKNLCFHQAGWQLPTETNRFEVIDMRNLLLASTALLILTSGAALASENDAYILQVGKHDKVHQTQEGYDDTAVALQAGRRNRSTQDQLVGSAGNLAVSVQAGKLNTIKQTQGAEGTVVTTFKPADKSDPVKTKSKFDIPSFASAAVAVQAGARNWATQSQIGAYNLASSVQIGKDNYVTQNQGTIGEEKTSYTSHEPDGRFTVRSDVPNFSVGSFAGVLQVGNKHGVIQEQTGYNHKALALQIGADDGSYQTQSGFYQEALSIQVGAANRSTQDQFGSFNSGAVIQVGVNNFAHQTQK
jgi:hypothetical protein